MKCSISNCSKNIYCRSWCTTHYGRWQRLGNPRASVKPQEQHRRRNAPEYSSWAGMRSRCRNRNHPRFKDYGGRGIEVCNRWNLFSNFLIDMGQKPKGYSLERIDNSGNYEPNNCRWASLKEQARNRRTSKKVTFNSQTKTIAEWSELTGINQNTILRRIQRGWPLDTVFE